ncbi:MAG: hydrogenase iron-sulfur subunit [Desulfobacteraceae bacterium]|nr:hydrogenase iron-sulfur subunit [Desulfobacteraceae bacterium]
MTNPRIGAVICDCQGEISSKINTDLLYNKVIELDNVQSAKHVPALCQEKVLTSIFEGFVKDKIDAFLFIGCSARSSLKFPEKKISSLMNLYGMEPSMFEVANIREQCAWIHEKGDDAFNKAYDQIRMAHIRLLNNKPLVSNSVIEERALIIGGGPAGLEAAKNIAQVGLKATLVEKKSYLGGRVPQIRILFQSENWNGKCISHCVGPVHVNNTISEPSVSAYVDSEIEDILKKNGNFHAKIRKAPEYVDPDKCISCGKCAEICPEFAKSDFEEGIYTRKAIDKEFPMAIPDSFNIIKEFCTECGECLKVCPADAINLKAKEQYFEEKFGAVFLSTGFEHKSLDSFEEYGTKEADVVTGMEFERIIDHGLKCPSDQREPEHIVFMLCAGSRAVGEKISNGVPYCSKTCCATTMKQAIQVSNMLITANITIVYYYDIRTYERAFEALYNTAKNIGIEFVQGNLESIEKNNNSDSDLGSGLKIKLEQLGEQKTSAIEDYVFNDQGKLELDADIVVLASAQTPKKESASIVEKLKIPLDEAGFPIENQPRIFRPTETFVDRVYAAGSSTGPKIVQQAVEQGRAAAMNVIPRMLNKSLNIHKFANNIDPETCIHCRFCEMVCPHGAISLSDDGCVMVDQLFCQGCGLCQAVCPTHAASLTNFSEKQILDQVDVAFSSLKKSEPKILGLLCYWCSYSAADFIKKYECQLPTNFRVIRTRCSSSVHTSLLFEMFRRGVDGIIVGGCPPNSCHHLHGNYLSDRRMQLASKLMEQLGLNTGRLIFDYIGVSDSSNLAKRVNTMDTKLRELGPNPACLQQKIGDKNEK